MFEELSVIIPVKKSARPCIEQFAEQMRWLLKSGAQIIIIDSGGGEKLLSYAQKSVIIEVDLSTARKLGIERADSEFTLNLDDDTIICQDYLTQAIQLLKTNEHIAVVAVDYEELQGHYAFGTSVWRTEVLKKFYDWTGRHDGLCECIHIWNRIKGKRMLIETLPYRAKHLKPQTHNEVLQVTA